MRLAAAGVRLVDQCLRVIDALRRGDTDGAEAQAMLLARAAVRNCEALARLDELPPRLRAFHRRQMRRKR